MPSRSAVLAVLVLVALAIVVAALAMQGGGPPKDASPDVRPVAEVRVTEGGSYVSFEGRGLTVREILEDALGDDLVLSEDGSVLSYKGKADSDGHRWTVYRWRSPEGWVDAGSSRAVDGMTLALDYSEAREAGGETVYSVPGHEVLKEAFFFIQIPSLEDLSSSGVPEVSSNFEALSEWLETAGVTAEDAEAGFWIKGEGRCVNEALADAVHDFMFPSMELERTQDGDSVDYALDGLVFHSHGIREDMYGWFLEFLGWSDVDLHNGDYTYWSQYSYNPNAPGLDDARQWTFDDWALGMYDMDRYRYFGLVLQTTQKDGADIELPTPATIPRGLRGRAH
ncbi:MAG: hypothetical protein IKQ60_07220 [Candidatus Methanomethylophilaceae archaeon]|nr:hypothetical protein [Candidatus Methanomethylophilaceae archaeon]